MKENTIVTRNSGKFTPMTVKNEPKPKKSGSNNRYKKLPALKGKFNERYYDGLYRFQDVPKVLEIGTG